MKKIVAFVLSAVMAAACAGCGSVNGESSKTQSGSTAATGEATVATAAPETLPNSVKKQIDQALSTAEFQGVMQISRGGSVIYQFVKGTDDNGQPLTIDASLPIASVSKQFCAAGVMLLSEKNKLSVDDTLDKYYPEYKFAKQLTLKNLLTMSSGIPDYYEKFMDGSALGTIEADNVKKIKEAIFGEELYFEPGDDYAYSNSNYFLLADIIEQVSGVPYHEYIRTNIFGHDKLRLCGGNQRQSRVGVRAVKYGSDERNDPSGFGKGRRRYRYQRCRYGQVDVRAQRRKGDFGGKLPADDRGRE